MIGAATAMATKRAARRRTTTPGRKVAPPDLGTEQTRARLQPPPWADWPRELQEAAIEMDVAVRVRIEALRCKGQVLDRIGGQDLSETLPPHEAHCYRRYVRWLKLMADSGWRQFVPSIIGAVVDGERLQDPALLRGALMLWVTGRVRPLRG